MYSPRLLRLQRSRHTIGVPATGSFKVIQSVLQVLEILLSQLYKLDVLLDSRYGGRSRNGNDCGLAGTLADAGDPGDGDLSGAGVLLVSQSLNLLNKLEVFGEVLVMETGEGAESTEVLGVGVSLEAASEDLHESY